MSVKGFRVDGVVQRYNFPDLDNISVTPEHLSQEVLDRFKALELSTADTATPYVTDSSWEIGNIDSSTGRNTGTIRTTIRSSKYFAISETAQLRFTGVKKGSGESSSRVNLAYCYDADKNYIGRVNFDVKRPVGTKYVRFTYGWTVASGITVDSYGFENTINDWSFEISSAEKSLKILVLGNSFSQDSFAYLPPVLNEILPEYSITYGVAYTSSANIQTHITMYNNNTTYGWWNLWNYSSSSWSRETSPGKKLTDIMSYTDWDIIYVQPATGISSDSTIQTNVCDAASTLLRILQSLALKPFKYIFGQWLADGTESDHGVSVYNRMTAVMTYIINHSPFEDYIPIGTAIQNARSNSTMQTTGEGNDLLYSDGQHMASGIAPLMAAYTIALKICQYMGIPRGVYGSTFLPTTANCIAINAYKNDGMVTPLPMTHGDSVGVSANNCKLAQEIAVAAVKNPKEITDYSSATFDS